MYFRFVEKVSHIVKVLSHILLFILASNHIYARIVTVDFPVSAI